MVKAAEPVSAQSRLLLKWVSDLIFNRSRDAFPVVALSHILGQLDLDLLRILLKKLPRCFGGRKQRSGIERRTLNVLRAPMKTHIILERREKSELSRRRSLVWIERSRIREELRLAQIAQPHPCGDGEWIVGTYSFDRGVVGL